MTAETSNARLEVVAERQAWYEQQIALAEGQWAASFLDRWECGDDVPSKEHYVALWLAERAAPPPAGDAEAEALAKYQPCGCVICTCEDEKQCQGCGAKHCGNRTNHPAYVKQQPEARGVVDGASELLRELRDLLASLPVDCLGSGTDASGQPYPIRDEVIDGITKQLLRTEALNVR